MEKNMFDKLWNNHLFKQAMYVLFESFYNGFLLIDKDGKIVFANKWYEEFIDINANDHIGESIEIFFKNSLLKKTLETGIVDRNVYDLRFKRPALMNRFPIKENGVIIGAISAFREIEEVEKPAIEMRLQMAKKGFQAKYHFDDIITQNPNMLKIKELAKIYANKSSTILITGESGTGKELFAQSIHNYSKRKNMPFVAINCTTLTETILESELFGYADSSFTGAKKGGKIGLFQLAHNGTIFLDEIGDMPLSFQSKLLRVIQEKQIRPVGSDTIIPIDVRVIAATNKNLREEVTKENFRLDLYYRLNVLRLDLLPLRERPEDIFGLSESIMYKKNLKHTYIKHSNKIKKILSSLLDYKFPGNIRELENMLERMELMLENDIYSYSIEDIICNLKESEPKEIKTNNITIQEQKVSNRIDDIKKNIIAEKLIKNNGDKVTTAAELGISVSTLYRKLKKYNI